MPYKDNKSHKKYFEEIIDTYRIGNKTNIDLLINLRNETSPFIKGDVLDIGNGGLINFDIEKADTIVLADIVLDPIKNPKIIKNGSLVNLNDADKRKITFTEADILKLPFGEKRFDVVLMFNVAHHLSVESSKNSVANIHYAMEGIYRVLRDGGLFLIWESCPSFFAGIFQDIGYSFLFRLLKKINKPLPYFLRKKEIIKLLDKKHFDIILVKEIKWGRYIYSPVFPSLVVPRWFWNKILRTNLFVAKKRLL